MPQPNFFIVGAPKCGTTSLSSYLDDHPGVYISVVKEPHFYASDLAVSGYVTNRDDYLALFRHASENHSRLGEASVYYLVSGTAIPRIKEDITDARLIVMVRNPIDMAFSYYKEVFSSGWEDVKDFKEAWKLRNSRRIGSARIQNARIAPFPILLDYEKICLLGEQLERLYRSFAREQVHVTFLEDFVKDPRSEYVKILAFLDLEDDGRVDFPVLNPRKEVRFRQVSLVVQAIKENRVVQRLLLSIKTRFNIKNLGILDGMFRSLGTSGNKSALDADTRNELQDTFRDDIHLLERLTGRDLHHWLSK